MFFIAAACAEGETLVRGAEELRVKETDRLAAMADGLAASECENQLYPDGLLDSWGQTASRAARWTAAEITGSRWPLRWPACGPRDEIEILDVANVATSFPGFVEIARAAGLRIENA